MVKFLHAADLHLGMRVTRFDEAACNRIGEARFAALEQLRAKAIEHQVQFILIAGDIFDDHSVSHHIAERAFTVFEGKSLPCPVYLIPGNHDPLTPGGVWDREPWLRAQPTKHVHLLREAVAVPIPDLPVTLFPCPLRNRNSIDDPTGWIANHPRSNGDNFIRIGLAHGSLNLFPNLPLDDHLIRRDAAEHYGLDYLALGHWHKPLTLPSSDGIIRTVYSGTHEPMRFPGAGAALSTGWSSYSGDGDAERFHDEGIGTAMLVTIDGPGTPAMIEKIVVGRLRWAAEQRDLSSHSVGEVISEFAQWPDLERVLLRLQLSGVTEPPNHARIAEVLVPIIRDRYHSGSIVDADRVLIKPNTDQLKDTVGDGVLNKVLVRLTEESQAGDPAIQRVAEHALKLLYRIAWEEKA